MRLQPNGNLGQVNYVGQASSPLTRRSLFGRATHELNDNLTMFAQANYASVEVSTHGWLSARDHGLVGADPGGRSADSGRVADVAGVAHQSDRIRGRCTA